MPTCTKSADQGLLTPSGRGCTALEKLSMAHNEVADLGDSLAGLAALQELRLGHNEITRCLPSRQLQLTNCHDWPRCAAVAASQPPGHHNLARCRQRRPWPRRGCMYIMPASRIMSKRLQLLAWQCRRQCCKSSRSLLTQTRNSCRMCGFRLPEELAANTRLKIVDLSGCPVRRLSDIEVQQPR